MTQTDVQKAVAIKLARERAAANDTSELFEKRKAWIESLFLMIQNTQELQTCEMYPQGEEEPLKSPWRNPMFLNQFHNTRKKIPTETRAEIDKLPSEKAIAVLCEFIDTLMVRCIHFAVFNAQGQRSPHIVIYDFQDLRELTPFQREQAQAQFWRGICPFLFHYLDASVWADEHPLPLEFAPHWKYGTPFNLLFEYTPEHASVIPKKIIKEYVRAVRKPREEPRCEIHGEIMIKNILGGYFCAVCWYEKNIWEDIQCKA